MPTVAEQLRAARTGLKLSIEQVAESTKVRTDHLRALEEGNYNVFPAPVYIRGTVRICAKALKLDVAAVLVALDEELGRTARYSEPPPLTEQKKTWLDGVTLLLAKLNWKVGFVGIGVAVGLILVVFTGWLWHRHSKANPLTNVRPAVYQPADAGDTLPLPRH